MIRKIRNNIFTIIGIILILSSFVFLINDILKDRQTETLNIELVEEFFEEEPEENKDEQVEEKEEVKTETSSPTYNYIAVLEIPSIGLKRGFVDFGSTYNSVKYNIQVIEHSEMPNVENSNLILAAHNGTSSVSFFNDLDKLKEDSLVYIYYDNVKYIYKINNHYEAKKDGMVEIIRNKNKTAITLITCKKNSDDKHLVYIGYLVDKGTY